MHNLQNRLLSFLLKSGLSVFPLLLHNSSAHSQGLDWKTQDSLLQIYGHQGDSVAQMENVTILKFQKSYTHPDDSTIIMPQEFECRVYDSLLTTLHFAYTSYSGKYLDHHFYSYNYSMSFYIVDHELRDFYASKSNYENEIVNNGVRDSVHQKLFENSSVHLVFYKDQLIFQMSDGHDLGAEETFDGRGYAFENLEYVLGEIRKKYPWIK